jgi:hypothetical protein
MTLNYQTWKERHPWSMCGGCTATGLEHAWTKDADYKPVEPRRPCLTCKGSGWFPHDVEQKST